MSVRLAMVDVRKHVSTQLVLTAVNVELVTWQPTMAEHAKVSFGNES